MALRNVFNSILFLSYPLLILCSIHISPNNFQSSGGFTIDLTHRDSPLSPLYDPSSTDLDRLINALRRSASRYAHFNHPSSPAPPQSQIVAAGGDYLMRIAIGSPPHEFFAIADTGSDFCWIQCLPCLACYKQTSPIFDPTRSSSYKTTPCNSSLCQQDVERPGCTSNVCQYAIIYADSSSTQGDVASETFTFASTSGSNPTIAFPNIAFGCSHATSGDFDQAGAGLVGLGGGPLSLISQLKKFIDKKFSYCLQPPRSSLNVTSKLSFGQNAIVSGPGTVSTPLVKNPLGDTFYTVSFESIYVGNKRLALNDSAKNTIIDSGTTFTFLEASFYDEFESELKQAIKGEPKPDSQKEFKLCYGNDSNINFPTIKVKFVGADGDLKLTTDNVFVENGDLLCLAMFPSQLSIFGAISQKNFLVGYELVKQRVSFKPTDCAKFQR
ncbi:Nepenthesin [Bertholletia excelsa]